MRKTIKTITTLKKHVGDTVHVVSYDGYEFDAEIVDNLRGDRLGLFTTDREAKKDSYWWSSGEGFAHIIVRPSQIAEELKSITLVKGKVTKTTKTFVSAAELKANVGHYCEMVDGSKGLIAGSEYPDNVCVLHNSEVSVGWLASKSTRRSEIKGIAKSLIKKFSKGWHVSDDREAKQVKVVKILDEVVKCKKASKAKEFLTASEIKDGVGHFCKMSDGSEGFIVWSKVCPRVLLHQIQDGHVWGYNAACEDDDNATAPESFRKQFEYGWNINGEDDAKLIKVVEILDAREKSVDESPKKTLLDMTIREVLEKLDEIIKR